MSERSLQSLFFMMGALAVFCLGSEHPIRHHRVGQKKSSTDDFGIEENVESTSFSVNEMWLHRAIEVPGKDSSSLTNYRKTEMKSVENLFRRSLSSEDVSSSPKSHQKEEDEIKSEKTGVSIKFSGKNYQHTLPKSYVNIKNAQREYMNSLQYVKPNKTSLWPLTYSPGTVEATLNNTSINITSEAGNGVFLPCRVGHLGDTQISWIRRRDWHVITSGKNIYSYDQRFSVLHDTSSHDWTLHILHVSDKDEGIYECQVSTDTGIISLFVNLSVIVPQATIVRKGPYHVDRRSLISLTCIITNNLIIPPHVLWRHNGELLNFLRDRTDVLIETEKPTISYKLTNSYVSGTNFSEDNNIYDIKSHLKVISAIEIHSGNYSCSTSNSQPASLVVFITEGDKTAAVQRIDSGAVEMKLVTFNPLFIYIILLVFR